MLFFPNTSIIFFSLFTDPNLGLYKNRKSGVVVPFGEYTNNLTDQSIWNDLIKQKIFTSNCKFSKDFLDRFSKEYEYLGRIEPKGIVINLRKIIEHISPNAKLVLILGSETQYLKNTQKAYEDRHFYNRELNKMIREMVTEYNGRVGIIDMNNFIVGQDSFTNNINHFTSLLYYEMAQQMISLANLNTPKLKQNSRVKYYCKNIFRKIKKFVKNTFGSLSSKVNSKKRKG